MRHAVAVLAVLGACGGSKEGPEAAAPPPLPTWSARPAASAVAEPAPQTSASAQAPEPGPPDPVPRIMRSMFPADLDPARARVGWIPAKKAFVYATGVRDETKRSSLTLVVASTDAATRRSIDVCAPADCPADKGRAELDRVLRSEGLTDMIVIEPILFPFPPKEVTVGAIAAQIRWAKDHLEVVRKVKVQKLAPIEAADRPTAQPISVAASPGGEAFVFSYSVGKQPDPNAAMKSVVYAVPPVTK